MTGRDRDRAAVYDAEQLVRAMFDRAEESGVRSVQLYGSTLTLPVERRFASVDSVQDYVDRVLGLNWVRAAGPVRVRSRAGSAAAHYEAADATIAVPTGTRWALRELVILHELAHHLAPDAQPPHGPEFRAVYLDLVDGVIGSEAAFLLRAALSHCGL